MDVINKFYNTVSSTVSQFSSVLPGNPVTREFEATCHIASGGPGLLWKIYKGYKKSTKQEAAIFVFEKRQLEKWHRSDRDLILESLKRGISQLTRLRHPQVLIVQHPLEESRESLAFATEPVFASLANILGQRDNMPVPVPAHLREYKLFEVEIKYGLLQIGEGLAFLHSDVKLLHRNISPENIIVNHQGAWKIFGFDYCVQSQNPHEAQPFWPFEEYSVSVPSLVQPPLDYLAPEAAFTLSHSPASDMFSLGQLILALHSDNGKPLYQCDGDYSLMKKHASELKQINVLKLNSIPDALREWCKMLLNPNPELRPDSHQFIKFDYFEDVGVKTLNYLDSLFQWDNLQKSQFYKGLPAILPNLPHRVCLNRVIPSLAKEYVHAAMVPFVLTPVLLVAEKCTKDEFAYHILPQLKTVMKLQEPVQILLIFMQKMELLLKLTPAEDIKANVLPMIYRALEADAQQIQELCLTALPTYASLIDYPAMKNALLPRIKRLCINTQYLSVRVNCLVCVGKLLEHLDKWLVIDEILTFLPQIPSREPAVLMGILGIYKLSLEHKKLGISKELMANQIIPFLMPLSIENGLTMSQFNALMILIKDMISRVETEQHVKLEQLNSIRNEQKTMAVMAMPTNAPLVSAPPPKTDLDNMFSGLGLDNFISGTDSSSTTSSLSQGVVSSAINYSQPIISNTASISVGNNLSLQEKQRLAKQQETVHRFETQPSLTPASALTPVQLPKPKDLTATLVENNLKQMQSSSSFSRTSNNNDFGPFASAVPTGGMSSTSPRWSDVGVPTPNAKAPQRQPQQSSFNSTPNYSAFDSLLPNNNNNKKIPLNQMSSQTTPLIPLNPNSMSSQPFQQQKTKILSSSEINDLLS